MAVSKEAFDDLAATRTRLPIITRRAATGHLLRHLPPPVFLVQRRHVYLVGNGRRAERLGHERTRCRRKSFKCTVRSASASARPSAPGSAVGCEIGFGFSLGVTVLP